MDSHKHQEEQLLVQLEPLLFKTLGRLNIRRVNADYDDFSPGVAVEVVDDCG